MTLTVYNTPLCILSIMSGVLENVHVYTSPCSMYNFFDVPQVFQRGKKFYLTYNNVKQTEKRYADPIGSTCYKVFGNHNQCTSAKNVKLGQMVDNVDWQLLAFFHCLVVLS